MAKPAISNEVREMTHRLREEGVGARLVEIAEVPYGSNICFFEVITKDEVVKNGPNGWRTNWYLVVRIYFPFGGVRVLRSKYVVGARGGNMFNDQPITEEQAQVLYDLVNVLQVTPRT